MVGMGALIIPNKCQVAAPSAVPRTSVHVWEPHAAFPKIHPRWGESHVMAFALKPAGTGAAGVFDPEARAMVGTRIAAQVMTAVATTSLALRVLGFMHVLLGFGAGVRPESSAH